MASEDGGDCDWPEGETGGRLTGPSARGFSFCSSESTPLETPPAVNLMGTSFSLESMKSGFSLDAILSKNLNRLVH